MIVNRLPPALWMIAIPASCAPLNTTEKIGNNNNSVVRVSRHLVNHFSVLGSTYATNASGLMMINTVISA